MIEHYFVEHEVLEVLFGERVFLKIKIECTHRLRRWLVIWEVQLLEVGMAEGLLDGDSLIGIVCQHFLQQINGIWIGSLEELVKILWVPFRKLLHKFLVFLIVYFVD